MVPAGQEEDAVADGGPGGSREEAVGVQDGGVEAAVEQPDQQDAVAVWS
jgi:hypothetical protein